MPLSPDSERTSLRIEVFVLCEAAQEFDGRLNLFGTFDTIRTAAAPVIVPVLTAAIRLRFWPEEAGGHCCTLRVIDNDGQPVATDVESEFAVFETIQSSSETVNLIVRFQSINLQREGEFEIQLYLDGHLEASLPFRLDVIPSIS